MEGDLSGPDPSVFLIDFVADKHNWNVFTDSCQILVPFGDVFVRNTACNIEHDDGAVSSNVVAFTQTTKFLLSGSVPQIELDWSVVCVENNAADVDSLRSYIRLKAYQHIFSRTILSDVS